MKRRISLSPKIIKHNLFDISLKPYLLLFQLIQHNNTCTEAIINKKQNLHKQKLCTHKKIRKVTISKLKFMDHAVVFQHSTGLPGNDDPYIGENPRFEFFQNKVSTNAEMVSI